jgi:hypothetical protein
MKKNNNRCLLWCLLILLVPAVVLAFRPAAGRADEPPAGDTSGTQHGPSTKQEGMSAMFQGTVVETIDAGRHIYVRIDTGKQRVWVAVPAFDGKVGDTVLVPPGLPVANFQSRKLKRKFKLMIFVGGIRRLDKSQTP